MNVLKLLLLTLLFCASNVVQGNIFSGQSLAANTTFNFINATCLAVSPNSKNLYILGGFSAGTASVQFVDMFNVSAGAITYFSEPRRTSSSSLQLFDAAVISGNNLLTAYRSASATNTAIFPLSSDYTPGSFTAFSAISIRPMLYYALSPDAKCWFLSTVSNPFAITLTSQQISGSTAINTLTYANPCSETPSIAATTKRLFIICGAQVHTATINSTCGVPYSDDIDKLIIEAQTFNLPDTYSNFSGAVASYDDKNVYVGVSGCSLLTIFLDTSSVITSVSATTVATCVVSLALSQDNRNLYALLTSGTVLAYARSSTDGALTLLSQSVTTGANPRALAIAPDGLYLYSLSSATSATVYSILRDASTQTPVLNSPHDSSAFSTNITVSFSLPETASSAYLTFANAGGNTYVHIASSALPLSQTGDALFNFTIDSTNPRSNFDFVNSSSNASIPEGNYTVSLTYSDRSGNPPASVSVSSVRVDRTTLQPSLYSPPTGAYNYLNVLYFIPEIPASSSVKLIMNSTAGNVVLTLPNTNQQNVSLNISGRDPQATSGVTAEPSNLIPDANYTISLQYQDNLNNPVAVSSSVSAVQVDISSLRAIFSSPSSNTVLSGTSITIVYNLTEATSSVSLEFVGRAPTNKNFSLKLQGATAVRNSAGQVTLTFNPANVTANPSIASVNNDGALIALDDGNYDLSIVVVDYLNNPPNTTSLTNITLDRTTQTPSFTSPVANSVFKVNIPINYTLPELPSSITLLMNGTGGNTNNYALVLKTAGVAANVLVAFFLVQDAPVTGSPNYVASITGGVKIADGTYTMTLSYVDIFSNPAAIVSVTNVTIDSLAVTPALYNPTSGGNYRFDVPFIFTIPEKPSPGTSRIRFNGDALPTDEPVVLTLQDNLFGASNISFTLNVKNLTTAGLSGISAINGLPTPSGTTSIPDSSPNKLYTVYVLYNDIYDNFASVFVNNIRIDTVTTPPTITSPATNTTFNFGSTMSFNLTIPESMSSGTGMLIFNGSSASRTLVLKNSLTGIFTFTWNFSTNPATTVPSFVNSADGSLPDDTYNLTLTYQDDLGNDATTAVKTGILVDTVTKTPQLLAPSNSTSSKNTLNVTYVLPEAAKTGSVKLIFTRSTETYTVVFAPVAEVSGTVLLNFLDPVNTEDGRVNNFIANPSNTRIPDGTYTVTLQYQDSNNNPIASALSTNVKLDSVTDAPTLVQPASNTRVRDSNITAVNIRFTLPETPTSGSVKLVLFNSNRNLTLTFKTSTSVNINLDMTVNPPTNSELASAQSTVNGGAFFPDGTYSAELCYQDSLGNNAACATVATNIQVDTVTGTPSLYAPVSNTFQGDPLQFLLNIPEAYFPDSALLLFVLSNGNSVINLTLANNLAVGNLSFGVPLAFPTAPVEITFASPALGNISDGRYNISFTYQDAFGNAAKTATVSNITIDKGTTTPTLTSPSSNSRSTYSINLTFTIPEEPSPDTVQLLFILTSNSTTISTLILNIGNNFGPNTVVTTVLNASDLHSSSVVGQVTGANSLPDGVYQVVLTYRDLANPNANATAVNFELDTVTKQPELISPVSSPQKSPIPIVYRLPEQPAVGSVVFKFVNASSSNNAYIFYMNEATFTNTNFSTSNGGGNVGNVRNTTVTSLPDGTYNISLSYQDTLFNPVATNVSTLIVIDTVTLPPTLYSPSNNTQVTDVINITFLIPERPSVAYLFFQGSGTYNSFVNVRWTLNNSNFGSVVRLSVNPQTNPLTAFPTIITATTATSFPDGAYTVSVQYQDAAGNVAATALASNVNLDTGTTSPSLLAPPSSSFYSTLMSVSYLIPEAAAANSISLVFASLDNTLNMTLSSANVNTTVSFDWVPQTDPSTSIANSPVTAVTSSAGAGTAGLPDGLYTATLSYRDLSNNPPATTSRTKIYVNKNLKTLDRFQITVTNYNSSQSAALIQQLAAATGAAADQIMLVPNSKSNSVVEFYILPPVRANETTVENALNNLKITLQDSQSSLVSTYGAQSSVSTSTWCFTVQQAVYECNDNSGKNYLLTYLLLGICGGVLLLACIIGFIIHQRDKKNKQENANKAQLKSFDDMDTNHDGIVSKEEYEMATKGVTSAKSGSSLTSAPAATASTDALPGLASWGKIEPFATKENAPVTSSDDLPPPPPAADTNHV